jgi:hypothetical protein
MRWWGAGTPSRWRRFAGPAVVLLAALVAVTPQLFRGNSCGHDFDFHLVSWFDALNSWRHGIPYPHWTPSANFGAGEPRFVFYPPLTWMLGAALGAVLPWNLVPIAVTFLLLAATGLATRALARPALADAPATLAGCAALFSGYALFGAYERSAFGELSGGFWIPLLLLLILHDRDSNPSASLIRRALDGSTAPLALVLAGAWLSNLPLGIIATYLLAAVALAAALLRRSGAPVVRAFIATVAGFSLAAIYLLPATWEQNWVDIRQATGDPGAMIETSWLFARHADPALDYHDLVLRQASFIVVAMVAVTLCGLLLSWLRGRLPGGHRWWIPLALIPVAVLVLQFPVSLPLWNLLPRLRFLQFPWRWLVVLEAPLGIFLASAIWPANSARRWRRIAVVAACSAVFLAMTMVAAKVFFQPCDEEDAVAGMLDTYRSGSGVAGTDEYAPTGADDSLVAIGLPAACLVTDPFTTLGKGTEETGAVAVWQPEQGSCDQAFSASPLRAVNHTEHFEVRGDTAHSGYLVLLLGRYPAWQIKVNGRPVSDLPQRDDGLLAVPVPQGPVDLTVDWITTGDALAGRWLSALAVLLLTALCALERKLSRPRLS